MRNSSLASNISLRNHNFTSNIDSVISNLFTLIHHLTREVLHQVHDLQGWQKKREKTAQATTLARSARY